MGTNAKGTPVRAGGRESRCRECDAASSRSYYFANRCRVIERVKAYQAGVVGEVGADASSTVCLLNGEHSEPTRLAVQRARPTGTDKTTSVDYLA